MKSLIFLTAFLVAQPSGAAVDGTSPVDHVKAPPTPIEETKAPAVGLPQRYEYVSPHMGTLWRLVFFEKDDAKAKGAKIAVRERLAAIEGALSDFKEDSELMKFCRAQTTAEFTATLAGRDLATVLALSHEMAQASEGAFDPTLGPLTQLWRASRKTLTLPSPAQVAAARSVVGWSKLIPPIQPGEPWKLSHAGMRLDFGGIAKGWAQDQVLDLLKREFGISSALIDAGGGVSVSGPPPDGPGWRVKVAGRGEVPSQMLTLTHASVATSGAAQQYAEIAGKRYSHIVDSHSGLGLTTDWQVSVISPSGAEADALATACCVLGWEKSQSLVLSRYPHLRVRAINGESAQVFHSDQWSDGSSPPTPAQK